MLGELNEMQIDHFLLSQEMGRIACVDGNFPYVVPITYVFDGKSIICQSTIGRKLEIMRKNPNVCFEVDNRQNMANWQSVIVHGTFQELEGNEAAETREYLFNHSGLILPVLQSIRMNMLRLCQALTILIASSQLCLRLPLKRKQEDLKNINDVFPNSADHFFLKPLFLSL